MATNATFDSLPENVENFFEDEGLLLPNVTLRRIYACTKAFSDDWWRLQDAVIEVEDVGVLISDPKYYRTRKSEREEQIHNDKLLLDCIYNTVSKKVGKTLVFLPTCSPF